MLKYLTDAVTHTAHKVGFWTRRKSPELLIASSILAAMASILLASKATLRAESIVGVSNKKIAKVKEKMNDDNLLANNKYSIEQGRKDLVKLYSKLSWELTKLYGPAAITFLMSVASILSSHKVMKGRNLALAAAYTTLENGYRNYRSRVKDKIGEIAENEIYKNIYPDKKKVLVSDGKGGFKEVEEEVKNPHLEPNSDYTYLFDESNPDWTKSGRMNIDFLLVREKFLNMKLKAQGYLFLYDVYDSLGIDAGQLGEKKLQASRVVGWIYDLNDPTRDNYVSFGLADELGNLTEEAMEMVRAGERSVWLEFNPDGDILTGTGNNKTFMEYAIKKVV